MNTSAVLAAVRGVEGVVGASEWTRVAGRERVYFDLARYNGISHELTSGVGVQGWIDAAGEVFFKGGAHNASLYYHRENHTARAIKAAAAGAINGEALDLTPDEEAEKEDWIR